MPYPHSASSHPPAPKKAGLCLFVVVEVGRGCRIVLALLVSHRAKLWASTITHPCVCGRLGRRVLAPTLCDRYRASLHVVLALLVSHPCLVSRLGCHICASTAICAVASVHRQPFVPLHRATALCGCLYASLHNGFVWLSLCILA